MPKSCRAVRDQLVGLFERAFVEQKLDPLAGRHLAFLVLPLAALLSAALGSQAVALLQLFQLLFKIHCRPQTSGVRPRTLDLKNQGLLRSEVRRPAPVQSPMLEPIGW